jgi:hypothetical protein
VDGALFYGDWGLIGADGPLRASAPAKPTLIGGTRVLLPLAGTPCFLNQFIDYHKNLLHSCIAYENIVHVIDFISITGALVVPASV